MEETTTTKKDYADDITQAQKDKRCCSLSYGIFVCVCLTWSMCRIQEPRSTLLGMYEVRYVRQHSVHKMKIEVVDPGRERFKHSGVKDGGGEDNRGIIKPTKDVRKRHMEIYYCDPI